MDKQLKQYSVEYECSLYGIIYYRDIMAYDFEEAKLEVHNEQPDAIIRAVSLLSEYDIQKNTEQYYY